MRNINLNKKPSAKRKVDLQRLISFYLLISFLICIFSTALMPIIIAEDNSSKITKPVTVVKTPDKSSTDEKTTTTPSLPTPTIEVETSTPDVTSETDTTTSDTTTTTTTPSIDAIPTSNLPSTSTAYLPEASVETLDSSLENKDSTKSDDSVSAISDIKTTSSILTNIVSTSEKSLGDIDKGEITNVVPENEVETSINEVKFKTSSYLKDVKLNISKLKNKPEEIKDIPVWENRTLEVYKYLDIKLTSNEIYVGETGIESMYFTFNIEKSWIIEYNIDQETVEMLRYHDGEWQHLNTTLITENETILVYEAETPGLSTFAVVGSEIVEVSASYVEEVPEIPWILNLGIIVTSSAILIFILFRSRYIYFDEKSVKRVKKKIDTKSTINSNQEYPDI